MGIAIGAALSRVEETAVPFLAGRPLRAVMTMTAANAGYGAGAAYLP